MILYEYIINELICKTHTYTLQADFEFVHKSISANHPKTTTSNTLHQHIHMTPITTQHTFFSFVSIVFVHLFLLPVYCVRFFSILCKFIQICFYLKNANISSKCKILIFPLFVRRNWKADQIAYSVLCVFSYVAAGQEQKKGLNAHKVFEHQKQNIPTIQRTPSPQARKLPTC